MTDRVDDGWRMVDEGWGRAAVEFATLSEPQNCREYIVLQHRLRVDQGDRLLDMACGAGLALELAALRGAICAGIDASPRLVAVARDRSPDADIRIGDMAALPWPDDSFDVATSFRGIWGTTEPAVAEMYRVLRPGGRAGLTVWGHIKVSPGAWALTPLRMAAAPAVAHQASMVALGRPGAGEDVLARAGFPISSGSTCRSFGNSPIPRRTRVRWHRAGPRTRRSSMSARKRSVPRRYGLRRNRFAKGAPFGLK